MGVFLFNVGAQIACGLNEGFVMGTKLLMQLLADMLGQARAGAAGADGDLQVTTF